MQVNWHHIKMLDKSLKSEESGFTCNESVQYDACMYSAVTQVSIVKEKLGHLKYSRQCWWKRRNPAQFPGFLTISLSAHQKKTWTLAFGLIIKRLPINRKDWYFWSKNADFILSQDDCPKPCENLALTVGGMNRELLPNNQSQVSALISSYILDECFSGLF